MTFCSPLPRYFLSASTWAAFAFVSLAANVKSISFASIDWPGSIARR